MSDTSLLGAPEPPPRGLEYLPVTAPEPGELAPVADGVHWLRMPLPMELDHINLWLIGHAGGGVLIDTGLASAESRSAWELLERTVLGRRPLRLIVLTHLHPDHVGLAAWLQERHGVPVWASHATEMQMRRLLEAPSESAIAAREAFLRAHGLPDSAMLRPSLAGAGYRNAVSGLPRIAAHPAEPQQTEWDGAPWRWLETDGHARGHLCLYGTEQRVLVCGDQVLPTISPNISLSAPDGDPDPLRSYLDSLGRLDALDERTLVLPSHGRPFFGLRVRSEELRAHHQRQLERLLEALHEPRTAFDTLRYLFRRTLAGFHLLLAMGEAIAHLEYLVTAGQALRVSAADTIRYVRR